MVALDHRQIGVRRGLDIFKVFVEQRLTNTRRKATSAGVKYATDIREHIDVIILWPTQLALIKVRKDLGPIVLEIANAHVEHGRRRYRAVVVQACRVVDLVLRNGIGKRLRETAGIGRYRVSLVKVKGEMVFVVEVVIDLEGRDCGVPEVAITRNLIVVHYIIVGG